MNGYNAMDATIQGTLPRYWSRLQHLTLATWQATIIVLATISSFAIPLALVTHESSATFYTREIILTIFFTADIFITRYHLRRKQAFLYAQQQSLRLYHRRWIVLEIVAALPFVLITGMPSFALLKLVKLSKVIHQLLEFRRLKIHLSNIILLLQIVYWAAIAAHWLSCGWLLIHGFDHDIDVYSNYVGALYWTATTLTTVGYGDIVPVTNEERLFAVATMILGYTLIGYLIGSIAGILTKKDPAQERYQQNMEKLANAVKYAQLPLDLQQRIHAYYTYMKDRRVGYDEASFIEELPAGLRAETSLHFRREVIERIPLFDEAPPEFILDIAPHLRERIVPPGDYIFRAGDTGKDMYLIARGEIGVYNADESRLLSTLREGDFFGEIALFKEIPRTATVKAESYCDVYTLTKQTLDIAFRKYPDIAAIVRAKAEQRLEGG